MKQKGFTLVELMVVIAIIGLLSSVVLVSLNSARAKARDARRMQDLTQISTALGVYYDTYGNYIETGSGCGYSNDGTGFFNYCGNDNDCHGGGTSYGKSIAQCLIDAGILQAEIIDPTGGRMSADEYKYMKYHCGTSAYVYARLEKIAQSDTATNGTCCPNCDHDYGMNYYLKVQ